MSNENSKEKLERNNQIKIPEDVEAWRAIIGEGDYRATLDALKVNIRLWFFTSTEEVDSTAELTKSERAFLKQKLKTEKWAGIGRQTRLTPLERRLNTR